ncbi:ovoinhibitor-like isoform X2 [Penaeus japonicus]|uniref:ovoinhibitor-like isoform X2 n=1 Tax=Penaeus japonicus TaxID=27405 RepID=UPI001C71010B|nr:ovoinhibitor-like isoform X2 [Penaeus japonicus]
MAVLALVALSLLLSTATAQNGGRSSCPESCPDGFRPVCGTDNKTYGNECKLFQAACRRSGLAKKNDGPCVSSNNCQRQCSSSYEPVCATDGATYDNKCRLAIRTCENPNVQLRYEGPCAVPANPPTPTSRPTSTGGSLQPASGSANRVPQVGQSVLALVTGSAGPQNSAPAPAPSRVTAAPARPASVVNNGGTTPRCRDTCQLGFRPVCGTDGKVYPNECKLRVASCHDPRIQKKNDGVCEKDCSIACPDDVEPVCGSNGVTYRNSCFYSVARCLDPAVTKVANAPCANQRDSKCDFSCDKSINPVCGSDGRTYQNQCKLEAAACTSTSLIKLYNGQCREQQGARCDTVCPNVVEEVCGDDGRTYRSHCDLIVLACRRNVSVNKAYDGRCRQAA